MDELHRTLGMDSGIILPARGGRDTAYAHRYPVHRDYSKCTHGHGYEDFSSTPSGSFTFTGGCVCIDNDYISNVSKYELGNIGDIWNSVRWFIPSCD